MDLSAALTNPYTLDTFKLYRRKQYINGFGETKVEVEVVEGVKGVVYPDGDNKLARKPQGQTQPKTLTVITRYAIRGESEKAGEVEYQPDIINWYGNKFVVIDVEDYSKYARGFVEVLATSIDFNDEPTTARPLSTQSPTVGPVAGFGVAPFNEGEFE